LKNLKQLPEQASTSEQIEQAFRIVHRALNQTAGETVLESQLDYFYENHPQLAGLRSDTDLFFKQSRQIFYETSSLDNPLTQDNDLLKSLKHLCLRYNRLLKQR
jgi:mxaA protein